jgi:lycopene beta-cyclase
VIDARGPGAYPLRAVRAGYQKFVGLEVRLQRPVDRSIPMLMDANVPQTDGFRFFYVLPYAPDRVLIEDTYFSDSPLLDQEGLREEVLAYAARNGYEIAEVLRTEHGVLPLPCGPSPARAGAGALVAGYGGGWFHPATGYSFPVAARLAQHVAETPVGTLAAHWAAWDRAQRRQFRYTAFLNWMLFTAFPPERRRNVFERFYRLPDSTIDHFYSHQLTGYDMARILIGRPPRGFSVRMALSGGTA